MEYNEDNDKFFEIVEKEEVKKKLQPSPPPQMITFDRYFLSLGKPMHHKPGMAAYLKSTKGKKTRAAWDALFKNY